MSQTKHRTDWMSAGKFGMMVHWIAPGPAPEKGEWVSDLNEAVDRFDLDRFTAQFAATGADWLIFTIGQNSGYYAGPNATLDELAGPGHCSRRHLVLELAQRVSQLGKRFVGHLPAEVNGQSEAIHRAFAWDPADQSEFQRRYCAFVRDYAVKFGALLHGWWFDGCYFSDEMYRHPQPPNFASFAAAARAGNPDSIVAFNPGVLYPIISLTAEEDYTAGEIVEVDRVECAGRWVDGAQFHMLSYLGPSWAQSPPRFSPEQVVAFTRGIVDKGGVVTWDVPIDAQGRIPPAFVDQLQALGKGLAQPTK